MRFNNLCDKGNEKVVAFLEKATFRKEIIQSIIIEENRFGFEPEITAKISKLNCRIFEVGISYNGRKYEDGKKIGWKDGVRTLYCILKYNLFRSKSKNHV